MSTLSIWYYYRYYYLKLRSLEGSDSWRRKKAGFSNHTTSLQRRKFVRTEDYGWKERKVKFQKPAITAFFYLINAVLRVLPWRQDDDPNRNPKGVYWNYKTARRTTGACPGSWHKPWLKRRKGWWAKEPQSFSFYRILFWRQTFLWPMGAIGWPLGFEWGVNENF